MASSNDMITLTLNCLCKANTFTTQLAQSELPLEGWACHCDSCRHTTGALCTIDATWPESRASVDISKLKSYQFTPDYDLLFCPTCFTPMFFANKHDSAEQLKFLTASLKNDPGNLIKITKHIFVGDTKDGGASMWLRNPNVDGEEAKRYHARDKTENGESAEPIPYAWPFSDPSSGYEAKTDGPTTIWCKCKGVNLQWQPGSYEGVEAKQLPWFVDPDTHKALGGMCGCESCRLHIGEVCTWGFAELKDISFADGREGFPDSSTKLKALVDARDPSIGTLTYFASSPDVQRYSCSNCSATVFYACDDRTFMVDIAMGLLEASDGARAEGVFSWAYASAMSHLGENEGGWRHDLLRRVIKEDADWRSARGYAKNWSTLARDKAGEGS